MVEVLFKCPDCLKHLAVDEAAKGRNVKCVDCGQPIEVPRATVPFSCPACGWTLSASPHVAGEQFGCPNCGEPLVMPDEAANAPANKGVKASKARTLYHRPQCEAAPRRLSLRQDARQPDGGRPCPECGSPGRSSGCWR